jgi:hypothetical protein
MLVSIAGATHAIRRPAPVGLEFVSSFAPEDIEEGGERV